MMDNQRGSVPPIQPAPRTERRGFAGLLRDLRDDATTLVRKEIALARTEMSEKVTGLSRNSVFMGIGGLILYTGSCFILLGLSVLLYFELLRANFSPASAVTMSLGGIGLILALVGGGLLIKGRHRLKKEGARLDKTMQSLEENREWAKHKVG